MFGAVVAESDTRLGRPAAIDTIVTRTIVTRRTALGLAAGLAAGSCGRIRDPARLTWWAMSTQGENAPLLLPGFARATGIGVDVQSLPATGAHAKILTAFAGGTLPDVLMVPNIWVAELASIGVLAPMPPALTGDQFPGVLASVRQGVRDVVVPWVVDTQLQVFKRDRVEATGHASPPLDRAGWKAMAHAIRRRHPAGYAVLLPLDWPEQLLNFAVQQGVPLLRDRNARGDFASPGFKVALAFYKSLFDEGLAPAITYAEAGDTLMAFHRGQIALLPASAQVVGDLRRRAAWLPAASWGAAEMPGPAGPARTMVGGSSLVVTATARDTARAWRLVAYLSCPDTQLELHAITGDLPSRISAWASPQLAHDPAATIVAGQLTRGAALPAVPEWQRIMTEVQLIAERMVRGEFGVDRAAALMDARTDALLEKRRWLLDRGAAA